LLKLFFKTCEFKNGKGDCTKTRESKKCIDNHCKIVKIPMKKTEILNNYYQNYANDIQVGSGKQNDTFKQDDTFKCPYCQKILPVQNLITHIKTHTNKNIPNNQIFYNIKPTNQSFDELFPKINLSIIESKYPSNNMLSPKKQLQFSNINDDLYTE